MPRHIQNLSLPVDTNDLLSLISVPTHLNAYKNYGFNIDVNVKSYLGCLSPKHYIFTKSAHCIGIVFFRIGATIRTH